MHELATNAAKHGALSVATGRVDLTWRIERAPDGDDLRLVWLETGGPSPKPSARRGFGRQLIEHSVGYSLSGRTEFELRPEGLRCEIVVPVDQVTPSAAPAAAPASA